MFSFKYVTLSYFFLSCFPFNFFSLRNTTKRKKIKIHSYEINFTKIFFIFYSPFLPFSKFFFSINRFQISVSWNYVTLGMLFIGFNLSPKIQYRFSCHYLTFCSNLQIHHILNQTKNYVPNNSLSQFCISVQDISMYPEPQFNFFKSPKLYIPPFTESFRFSSPYILLWL